MYYSGVGIGRELVAGLQVGSTVGVYSSVLVCDCGCTPLTPGQPTSTYEAGIGNWMDNNLVLNTEPHQHFTLFSIPCAVMLIKV